MDFIIIGLTVISLIVLVSASTVMLNSSIEISKRLNISPLITGSTIVAIGTGLPTIAVSVIILLTNPESVDVAIGNVVGTNAVNLGLALGIPAFLTTIVTKYSVYEKELPLYLAMIGLVTTFAVDEKLSRGEGTMIFLAYVVIAYVIYQYAKRERKQPEAFQDVTHMSFDPDTLSKNQPPMWRFVLVFLVGFVILIAASFLLSMQSSQLSNILHISPYIVGLTIVGIGTSLPTIVSCIQAARSGFLDIVLGNVFGGNIVNLGLGLGIPAMISAIPLSPEAISDITFSNQYNLIIILLILIEMKLLGSNKTLSQISGIIIVGTYLLYLLSKIIPSLL